jgi:hypothetical protein
LSLLFHLFLGLFEIILHPLLVKQCIVTLLLELRILGGLLAPPAGLSTETGLRGLQLRGQF